MKKQIEEFVQGLLDSTLTDEQQSIVLQNEMDMTGAINPKVCSNAANACRTTNYDCTNYGDYCVGAINEGVCVNRELVNPNTGNCLCSPGGSNKSVSC